MAPKDTHVLLLRTSDCHLIRQKKIKVANEIKIVNQLALK